MEHAFGTRRSRSRSASRRSSCSSTARPHRLAPDAAEVLRRAIGLPAGSVGHEAFAAEIELRSPPAADAGEAAERARRRRAPPPRARRRDA